MLRDMNPIWHGLIFAVIIVACWLIAEAAHDSCKAKGQELKLYGKTMLCVAPQ